MLPCHLLLLGSLLLDVKLKRILLKYFQSDLFVIWCIFCHLIDWRGVTV